MVKILNTDAVKKDKTVKIHLPLDFVEAIAYDPNPVDPDHPDRPVGQFCSSLAKVLLTSVPVTGVRRD